MTIKNKKRKHNRNNRNSDGLNSFKEITRSFRKKRSPIPIKLIIGTIAGVTAISKFVLRHLLPNYGDNDNNKD